MNRSPAPSKAQYAEVFLERTALGILLLALVYGCAAAEGLSHGRLAQALGWIQLPLRFGVVAVLLPAIWRYFRRARPGCGHRLDGFVAEMFRRAALATFCATFLLLLSLEFVTRKGLVALSPSLIAQGLLCASLGVFGISFMRMARVADEENADDPEPQP
jgi:hypothetical protein